MSSRRQAAGSPDHPPEIKADSLFRDSPLVRQGRLSVVQLTDDQFRRLTQG